MVEEGYFSTVSSAFEEYTISPLFVISNIRIQTTQNFLIEFVKSIITCSIDNEDAENCSQANNLMNLSRLNTASQTVFNHSLSQDSSAMEKKCQMHSSQPRWILRKAFDRLSFDRKISGPDNSGWYVKNKEESRQDGTRFFFWCHRCQQPCIYIFLKWEDVMHGRLAR